MAKANQKIYKQGRSPESIAKQAKQDADNANLCAINRVGIPANRYCGVK